MIKKKIIFLALLIVGLLAISSVSAGETANETSNFVGSENTDVSIENSIDYEMQNQFSNEFNNSLGRMNEIGGDDFKEYSKSEADSNGSYLTDSFDTEDDYLPEDIDETVAYKVALFSNKSVVTLSPDKIQWSVKKVTESVEEYDETVTYYITLSTFKISNVEYTIAKTVPTSGVFGDGVYVKFNPDEYDVYDGIFYKISGGSITDIISPAEYSVFDGQYYKLAGIMVGVYELADYVDYSIINNECYKFTGSISPQVIGFFKKATKGVDYNIIDGEYRTLDEDLIEEFSLKYYGEVKNDEIVIGEGYYLQDGSYCRSHNCRYSILPYDYVKVNGTFVRLIYGKTEYNTTEEYEDESYVFTKNVEYALIDNKLYSFLDGAVGGEINLTSFVKEKTQLTAADINKAYNTAKNWVITLKDSNGNPLNAKKITIALNGKTYTGTTNDKGQMIFAVPVNLNSKTYTATVSFAGDKNYGAVSTTARVVVNKQSTKLTASGFTMIYNNGRYLVATLKDNAGKVIKNAKVSFKVAGKTYTLKTDAKGQVKLFFNLVPKAYAVSIIFAGDNNYQKSLANVKVIVKKAAAKIYATNRQFKAKAKIKYFSMTLKDNKFRPLKNSLVLIKVYGKIYYAKTNAKGVATFKINKLTKVGNHRALIRFGGNGCYYSLNRYVNIGVKR